MSDVQIREMGGVYTLVWEQEGIGVRIDRLVEDSKFSVTGEVQIKLVGRHIHQARMNLTSTRGRADVIRQCTSRQGAEHIDWNSFLEEASITVLEKFRTGASVIDFLDYEPPNKSNFLFDPFLLDGEANLIYGAGGSGKSYFASYVAAHVSKGYIAPDGFEVPKSKVLYLDYETGPEEIFSRLKGVQKGLQMDENPEIIYHPSAHPLASEIDKIQRIVAEHDIDLVIVDSVGYACGGEPETAMNAINYYNALRQLSVTSLSIGHVSKDRNSSSPFGSVYWINGSRMVWEMVRSQESGMNYFDVGILHRKINNGALKSPVGFRLTFENEGVYFDSQEVKLISEVEEKLPLKDRIYNLLEAHESLDVKELASMLDRTDGTIRKTLHRNENIFYNLKEGGKSGVWILAETSDQVAPNVNIFEDEDIFGPAVQPAQDSPKGLFDD